MNKLDVVEVTNLLVKLSQEGAELTAHVVTPTTLSLILTRNRRSKCYEVVQEDIEAADGGELLAIDFMLEISTLDVQKRPDIAGLYNCLKQSSLVAYCSVCRSHGHEAQDCPTVRY